MNTLGINKWGGKGIWKISKRNVEICITKSVLPKELPAIWNGEATEEDATNAWQRPPGPESPAQSKKLKSYGCKLSYHNQK